MRKLAAMFFGLAAFASAAFGQDANNPTIMAPYVNGSVPITLGLTYQQILPAIPIVVPPLPSSRHSFTIENNNTNTDSCWFDPTSTVNAGDTTTTNHTINGKVLTAAQASVMLLPGGSRTWSFPYIPANGIVGTCASTGDTFYVDTN